MSALNRLTLLTLVRRVAIFDREALLAQNLDESRRGRGVDPYAIDLSHIAWHPGQDQDPPCRFR